MKLNKPQGPRSNFEIGRVGGGGGEAPIVTQYWGGTRHFFLLTLYNFKNIGGARAPPSPPPPAPRSLSSMYKERARSFLCAPVGEVLNKFPESQNPSPRYCAGSRVGSWGRIISDWDLIYIQLSRGKAYIT